MSVAQLPVPPHSIDAEQSVLGAMMLSEAARIAVGGLLQESDFYRKDHQCLFRAIRWLDEKKKPCDAVTIGDWIAKHGLQETIGSADYIVELAQTVPGVSRAKAYAEIVLEKSQLRQMIEVGNAIANAAFDPGAVSAIELIGKAQTQVGSLMRSQPTEIQSADDVMQEVFAELGEAIDRGEKIDGLATGFPDWDDITGGLPPGVHYLGGSPKHGKSTLAQNVAEYVTQVLRKPVLALIFEMTAKQWAKRLIASVGHVNAMAMRRGELNDIDWANASDSIRKMRKAAKLFISRPKIRTPERVCAEIRKQHAETPLALVILDYFQLMEFPQARGENEASAMARGSKMLVDTALDLGIPFLVLSALNREATKDGPKASHMRGTGGIEADAESITLVYRDEIVNRDSRWKNTIEVIVGLNRNGPTGECRLLYHGAQYRCESLPYGWEPEAPPEKKDSGRRNAFKAKATGSRAKKDAE